MKRPANAEMYWSGLKMARDMPRDYPAQHLYCWFPGETEEEFEELLDFLEEAQLDRVGAFMYSPVEALLPMNCPTIFRLRCRKSVWTIDAIAGRNQCRTAQTKSRQNHASAGR